MKRSKSLTGKTQESILNILTDEQREKFNQIRGRLTKRSNAQSPL
jgi:Spy/CpxP family protein refolding chaperone